jgi:hypothetical protein
MVVGRLELVSLLPPVTDVLATFPEVVSSSRFAEAARITLPQFWALLIILFAFAFIASEAVAHFERKVSFYASSR